MNIYRLPERGVLMDISSLGSDYTDYAIQTAKAEEEAQVEALYAVKLMKMAQQSDAVVGSIIEDTVEISREAMQKFMSERGG